MYTVIGSEKHNHYGQEDMDHHKNSALLVPEEMKDLRAKLPSLGAMSSRGYQSKRSRVLLRM